MAEIKKLNTRIKLRVDTLENWESSSLVLLPGEVAIATVAATEGTGLTEPVTMIKIGTDEEKTFSELPWALHAKAADVLAACKSEAGLKAFVNDVISKAGIATDEAMQVLSGKVTTAEGKITALEGTVGDAEKGLVKGVADNAAAIAALQGLVGDQDVATRITNAINGLSTVYAAKSLETTVANHVADEVSHVTTADKTTWNAALQAADVTVGGANGTIAVKGVDVAVKGLGSAAFTESTAYDVAGAAAAAETAAKSYADGLAGNYDAKGSAAAAETAAKSYADGLAKNYDAVGSASAAEAAAKKYTDEEIAEWVGDKSVTAQIEELKLSETYDAKGAAAAAESAAKAHATGLNTAMNARVEALEAIDHDHANAAELAKIADGDVAKWNAAEQNAKNYADGLDQAMDLRVDALEARFGEGEGNVESQIEAAVAAEAKEREDADAELQKAIDAIEEDYLTSVEEKALQDQIDAIDTVIGDVESIATYVSGAVAAEAELARAAEKANADAIKAIKDDYLTSANQSALEDAIEAAEESAVDRILGYLAEEQVNESYDTLKEVAAWIESDTTASAQLVTRVSNIEADYLKAADKTELEGKITAAHNAANAAQGEVDALEEVVATKAAQADLNTLSGKVTTAEGKITTLEGEMDDAQEAIIDLGELIGDGGTVQAQISKAITDANLGQYAKAADLNTANGKISTLEGQAHTHANAEELAKFVDGDKAKLDAAVQTVTAGTGLTATKTGTDIAIGFDDSVTFIFDCGSSVE